MGHGHEPPYKIPDASIYKVEDIPLLFEVQQALARQGLRDPWLRNEVWRYTPANMGTHASRARAFFSRGFVVGFGAFVATIAFEKIFLKESGHGHGHDHGDSHGKDNDKH